MIGKLLKDLVAGGYVTIGERTITVRRMLRCAWRRAASTRGWLWATIGRIHKHRHVSMFPVSPLAVIDAAGRKHGTRIGVFAGSVSRLR